MAQSVLDIFNFYILDYSMSSGSCYVMINISARVEYIFQYIFRILNHLVMKLSKLKINDIMGNNFELEDCVVNLSPYLFTNLQQQIKK